jgi:hypothetical protein
MVDHYPDGHNVGLGMVERESRDERDSRLYHELLYAVARKFRGETRHQTALRYIREAEARASEPGQAKQVPTRAPSDDG